MKLLSVNLGKARIVEAGPRLVETSIYKLPLDNPVQITVNGLQGDTISNTKDHGGPDQAVYLYGSLDYDWWSAALGKTLEPGTFGENLTISDLESASLHIGDRLHIGSVLLEITAPRIPCVVFALRMNDPAWLKRFRKAERPGLYCRVIEPGKVQVNDPVTLEPYTQPTVTVLEVFRGYYDNDLSEDDLRRTLATPIAIRARQDYEERLAAITT
ncbi:MAG: MOSC domain-containing protein [Chloroflexota bacterium]